MHTTSIASPCRGGFTLIEALVAILLVNAGIVALMTATAVAARAQRASYQQTAAVRTAVNRIELLSSQPCSSGTVSGDTVASFARGARERWSATVADGAAARELRDSVGFPQADSTRWIELHASTLC